MRGAAAWLRSVVRVTRRGSGRSVDTRVTSAIMQIQTEFADGSRPVTGDIAHLSRLIVVGAKLSI